MVPTLGTAAQGSRSAELAIKTSQSIEEISKLVKGHQTSRDLKRFYVQMRTHCILVRDHINRLRSMWASDNDYLARVLDLFESLIRSMRADSSRRHAKQHALNQSWDALRSQDLDAKLKFAEQCLDVPQSSELRPVQAINDAFEAWEDDVLAAYPEDGSQWMTDDRPPPRKGREEPSYAVWSAAQSLFKALATSTKCGCVPKHEVDATLCLGTYRKPNLDDTNDFDMFLSLQQEWQEVHVHTVRNSVVRIVLNENAPPSQKKLGYKPMPVKELCAQIRKMHKTSDRLEFKVERDRLLKLRSKKITTLVDTVKPTVSLQQFIKEGSRSLTEKTKRILAVLLSYAVLHLHGTPWLQPTWDSSKILFFRTLGSKIPLRPFIQTQLGREDIQPGFGAVAQKDCGGCSSHVDDDSASEVDPDDLDPDDLGVDDLDPDDIEHPFHTLVTLAIILMELYMATPFAELVKNRHLGLPERPDHRTRLLDVASVFDEYRREIPQNTQFYYAIERCLDLRTWKDERGQKLDDQALRVAMYREVVRPLEDELCDAFTFITIEELDKMAEIIDVGSWGQTIHNQQSEGFGNEAASPPTEQAWAQQHQFYMRTPSPFQPPLEAWNWDPRRLPNFYSRLEQQLSQESEYDAPKFYDDEKPPEAHSHAEIKGYLTWKAKYKDVYKQFIDPYLESLPTSAVKIAVLDSGVDDTHTSLETGQIQTKWNWTSTKFKRSAPDRDGHGTFCASLIIDYAPDAELYIAKIAKEEPSPPAVVAEAIRKAVDDWKVDIISMSFGYPTNQVEGYKELENAILYAHSKNVLMFTAASNSGANLDRAYPARDQHVICIHSTTAEGDRSKFSPTALSHDINLATIGEAVQSAWPVSLCDPKTNPDCVQSKSGTSYAAPIAVGIAAFLLQYARLHLADQADLLKRKSKMQEVFLKIAEKTQRSKERDDYHYVALSLYADNLFGKDKQFIDVTLGEILRH
ncbi:putative subtilisin [Diaporthe sp. PMI_573]|nr:putative subtilisin [Diaporthaceae sp. PMI_573]